MLQEQARVDRDQDGRCKPAHEAKDPVGRVRVLQTRLLHQRPRTGFSDRRNDSGRTVKYYDSVGERNYDRRRYSLESRVEECEGRVDHGGQRAEKMEKGRVGCHDYRRKRGKVGLCRGLGVGILRVRRHVVCKNLVDAQDDVCEEQRRLDGVPLAAPDSIPAEEEGRRHGDTYQSRVQIVNLGKSRNPPQEVDGSADYGAGEDEQYYLGLVSLVFAASYQEDSPPMCRSVLC